MACTEQRREQIAAVAAGRADPAAMASLLGHVEECRDCSDEFDLVSDLVAAEPDAPGAARHAGVVLLAAAVLIAGLFLWKPWGASRYADLAQVAPIRAPEALLRGPEGDPRGPDHAEGMEAYRAGDFAAAAATLGRVAERRPADALVHLYLGIARLQTGAPSAAVDALKVAAEKGTGLVRERGLWYLAGAWLLLDRPAHARDVLEELRREGGDYEANAEALLGSLRRRGL